MHLLADSDPRIARALRDTGLRLPPCGLTAACPGAGGARCAQPLYRSTSGGIEIGTDGSLRILPFDRAGSGGSAPDIAPEVAQRLAELGYAGR
jgi:hypothetical protein